MPFTSIQKSLLILAVTTPATEALSYEYVPTYNAGHQEDALHSDCQLTNPKNSYSCSLRDVITTINASSASRFNVYLTDFANLTAGEIKLNPGKDVTIYSKFQVNENRHPGITGRNGSIAVSAGAKLTLKDFSFSFFQNSFSPIVKNEGELIIQNVTFNENKLTCQGTGVLSASSLCYYPSAILNQGTLTLENVSFINNRTDSNAFNAATTYASTNAGALVSSGHLILNGKIYFIQNTATATAQSVERNGAPMGATAVASGGAMALSGSVEIGSQGLTDCQFVGNKVTAVASSSQGEVKKTSRGGAIVSTNSGVWALENACVFSRNSASEDNDISAPRDVPAPEVPQPKIKTDIEYLLVSKYSGKCLDVKDLNTQNGAGMQQWDCFGGDNQRFRFVDEGNGFYSLVSKLSQRCLSAQAIAHEDGTPAIMWECHSGEDQRLKPIETSESLYELRFAHSDKCLDVAGPSRDNGASVQQWSCFSSDNQKWTLRPAD